MKKTVTITARITPALNKKLVAYAKAAKRTKSWLIEDIIDRYIDGEIAFVEAVNVGIRELDEGKGIPHEEVMRHFKEKSAKFRRAARTRAA